MPVPSLPRERSIAITLAVPAQKYRPARAFLTGDVTAVPTNGLANPGRGSRDLLAALRCVGPAARVVERPASAHPDIVPLRNVVSSWNGRWCLLVCVRSHALNSLICIFRSCVAEISAPGGSAVLPSAAPGDEVASLDTGIVE